MNLINHDLGSFSGIITLYGTSTRTPASWDCTLDGKNMDSSPSSWDGLSPVSNRQTACYIGPYSWPDGLHELHVSVNGTKDGPIWFDFINFTPSDGVATTNFGDLEVGWTSDQIDYGDGWWGNFDSEEAGNVGFKYGATMDFKFFGSFRLVSSYY